MEHFEATVTTSSSLPGSRSLEESLLGWRVAPSPDILDAIAEPTVNVTCWQRRIPFAVTEALAAWALLRPSFETTVSAGRYDLAPALVGLAEPHRAWLMKDIAVLVARFAGLARSDRARVSFGTVRTNACQRFHVDTLRFRLVTTYLGPGTEWVPNEAVCRDGLEHPIDCLCDANQAIVPDGGAVRHAATGDVLVMKGHSHEHGPGAVHRSPPIEGVASARVVLVVSTVKA